MMTTTINMTFGSVVLGLLLFVIPIYTLYLLRVDVWRKALKALGRMVVALGAAALLTQAALWLSNIAFTLLCAVVMVAVTAAAMVARSRIRQPRFVVPVALGLLLTAVPLGLYFVFLVLGVGTPLDARYFLPTMGLVVGAVSDANTKALGAYYDGLRHHARLYFYLIGNGATRTEAIGYFTRRSLKRAVMPGLSRMGILAIGTAPVTMWVMVFCGLPVATALLAQLLLVGLLIAVSVLSLILTLVLARRYAFDQYDNIQIDA